MLRDGWLFTGDTGYMDEKGYLYIVGRKEFRISAGGHTVWPEVVEEVLAGYPHVSFAVAIGVPDPLRCSTDILAVVVTVPEKEVCESTGMAMHFPEEIEESVVFQGSLSDCEAYIRLKSSDDVMF